MIAQSLQGGSMLTVRRAIGLLDDRIAQPLLHLLVRRGLHEIRDTPAHTPGGLVKWKSHTWQVDWEDWSRELTLR